MLKLEMNAGQRDRGRLIAVVHGDLDHENVVELCTRACDLIDAGSRELVLDLSAARHHDAAEHRALAWLQERMRIRGVLLTIRAGASSVVESSRPVGGLGDPTVGTCGNANEDLTRHCEKPGALGYRPETAEQP